MRTRPQAAVVVTVTAKDKARVAEIQKRAEHLDKVAVAPDMESKYTRTKTGGGEFDRCPVVMADVTLKVEKQRDGVKVTLTPRDRAKVGEIVFEPIDVEWWRATGERRPVIVTSRSGAPSGTHRR